MMRTCLCFLVFTAGLGAAPADRPEEAQTGGERPVTSREIDQLRRELCTDTRSSVEGIFEFHTETGDLNNRLDFWRYGTRLNYRAGSATTLYVSGVRTDYRSLDSLFKGDGLNVTGGVKRSLGEGGVLRLEGGATRFNTQSTTVNALGSLEFNATENLKIHFTGTRSNVEESMLSATGLRPSAGPNAGTLVGQVMDNRFLGGATLGFLSRWDVFGEGGGGVRTGQNIESNPFRAVRGGVGFNAIAEAPENAVSLLRASYALDYFGFDKNLFGYSGASLTNSPGFVSSSATAGTGGYFSPQKFVSHTGRVELKGKPADRFEYNLTGFAGSQSYTGSNVHRVYGFAGTAVFHLNDRFSLPVSYLFDNIGPFKQQTLLFRLVVAL